LKWRRGFGWDEAAPAQLLENQDLSQHRVNNTDKNGHNGSGKQVGLHVNLACTGQHGGDSL